MWILIIVSIILVFLIAILNNVSPKVEEKPNKNIDYSNFTTNNYLMTVTELKFYRELKKITDKLDMIIFPQVDLERIVKVKNNNKSDRQRIKARSIDFTIVENTKCRIICCIELDDKSHQTEKAQYADNLKNNIFKQINIPLYRFKVDNYYNLEDLEAKIKLKSYQE